LIGVLRTSKTVQRLWVCGKGKEKKEGPGERREIINKRSPWIKQKGGRKKVKSTFPRSDTLYYSKKRRRNNSTQEKGKFERKKP